jgi:hypothetical protein
MGCPSEKMVIIRSRCSSGSVDMSGIAVRGRRDVSLRVEFAAVVQKARELGQDMHDIASQVPSKQTKLLSLRLPYTPLYGSTKKGCKTTETQRGILSTPLPPNPRLHESPLISIHLSVIRTHVSLSSRHLTHQLTHACLRADAIKPSHIVNHPIAALTNKRSLYLLARLPAYLTSHLVVIPRQTLGPDEIVQSLALMYCAVL